MKRQAAVIILCSALLTVISVVAAAQPNTDFSGNWVLDMKRTKDIPTELKGYRLIVKQGENNISFESRVEGSFGPSQSQDQNKASQSVALSAAPTAVSSNNTVGGIALGSVDSSGNVSSNKTVIARGRALSTVIRRMNCTLDGKEVVREISGLSPGKIKRRGFWKKGEKMLELNIQREFEAQGSQITSTVKELWELAEDGKVLKIKRTVNLLAGWDETTLVFTREPVNP